MKKGIFISCVALMLFACSEENPDDKKIDVFEIRNIGLLATSEFTIGKVIELKDDDAWYKFGDRNILISCKAKVKAGIDLTQIGKEDISVSGNRIKISLPYPTILSFNMNPNDVRTEVQDINGFRSQFNQDEKNEILAQGEKAIRENLKETSILANAKNNAEVFIENFYQELGYKHVEIEFKKPHQAEMGSR